MCFSVIILALLVSSCDLLLDRTGAGGSTGEGVADKVDRGREEEKRESTGGEGTPCLQSDDNASVFMTLRY